MSGSPCTHDNYSLNGIRKARDTKKWVLTCSKCQRGNYSTSDCKPFQFSRLQSIIQNAQREMEELIEAILSAYSEYRSNVFSTFIKMEELQEKNKVEVVLNSFEEALIDKSCQSLKAVLLESIDKQVREKLALRSYTLKDTGINSNRAEDINHSGSLGKSTINAKPKIQMMPNKLIFLPQKYPEPRVG